MPSSSQQFLDFTGVALFEPCLDDALKTIHCQVKSVELKRKGSWFVESELENIFALVRLNRDSSEVLE